MKDEHSNPIERGITEWTVTRRDFLKGSGWVIAGLASGLSFARAGSADSQAKLSFGIVTDTHYADTGPRGSRQYRDSIAKMTECVSLMNDKQVDFLIELGDFKDQGQPATEETTLEYLSTIERVFGQFNGPRYHVLGNHDVDGISKAQFLARVENTGIAKGSSFYSFESKGFHLVVLDANYKADGSDCDHGNFNAADVNIPPEPLNWLKQDLASSSKPVMVFIHHPLDVAAAVKNAAEVRQVLQDSTRVLAVFQGHHHPGRYSPIEGIHYYTLKAMVEGVGEVNNAYAIVEVQADHSIIVTGYRKAISKALKMA